MLTSLGSQGVLSYLMIECGIALWSAGPQNEVAALLHAKECGTRCIAHRVRNCTWKERSRTRTSSGAILSAHRFPLYSVNVSRDDGLNWDAGTAIDYPAWAMDRMFEVEPDVALAAYMNAERSLPLLLQRIRVTPQGLQPEP